jgi:hypothetical protein
MRPCDEAAALAVGSEEPDLPARIADRCQIDLDMLVAARRVMNVQDALGVS